MTMKSWMAGTSLAMTRGEAGASTADEADDSRTGEAALDVGTLSNSVADGQLIAEKESPERGA